MSFEKLKASFKSDPETGDLPISWGVLGIAALAGTMLMMGLTDNSPEDHKKALMTEEVTDGNITYQYLDNSTRLTLVDIGKTYSTTVITFCDGLDMVDLTRGEGNIERSVAHDACADGRLTQEDFNVTG